MNKDRTNKTPDGQMESEPSALPIYTAPIPPDVAPTFDQIRTFKLLGDPEKDRLVLTLPVDARRAAHYVHLNAPTAGLGHVVQWALCRGLERLGALPRVQTITTAQRTLVDLGDASLNDWKTYQPRADTVRTFLKQVNPRDSGRASRMAESLGLTTGILGAVAVMAALYDVPTLPANLVRLLVLEINEFHAALRVRAPVAEMTVRAVQAARQAAPKPSAAPPWHTFDEYD